MVAEGVSLIQAVWGSFCRIRWNPSENPKGEIAMIENRKEAKDWTILCYLAGDNINPANNYGNYNAAVL